MNKLISEMSNEELSNFIEQKNKEIRQKQLDRQQEQISSITIEANVNTTVRVDVIEETDSEFFRRVRFNIKVEEFRNRPVKQNKRKWFNWFKK